MSHKVIVNREGCIACCNCHSNCPEVFELNDDDGLAQIRGKYRIEEGSLREGEVPNDLEDCVQTAVDICPVQIIYIE